MKTILNYQQINNIIGKSNPKKDEIIRRFYLEVGSYRAKNTAANELKLLKNILNSKID